MGTKYKSTIRSCNLYSIKDLTMKKNQLLGVLSFIMVLGMTFPAGLFVADTTSQSASILPHAEQNEDEDENLPNKDKNKEKNRPKRPKTPPAAAENLSNIDDGHANIIKNNAADASTAVINPQIIRSYDELMTILTDPEYAYVTAVRLTNDIILTRAGLEISRDNFTIDLNGHSIISCGIGNGLYEDYARVIDVKSGNFTITGTGNIMAMGQGGVALSVRGSSVESSANYATINIGSDVTLRAPSSYGLIVMPSGNSAYGVTVNLAGKISAENGIYINSNIQTASSNSPTFNFADTSNIEAEQTVIYAAGFGIWNFHGGEFSGATGIRAKAGDFIFDQARIVAQVASLHDASASGAVFQIEEPNAEGLTITIHDGYYESSQACVFSDYNETDADSALNALTIDGGTFVSPLGIFSDFATGEDSLIAINGGIFSADITAYLASGTHLEPDSDGFYHVVDEAAVELSALRTKLQTLIDTAGAKNPDYFSDATYQELMTVLVDAVHYLKTPEPTIKQIRKHLNRLSAALDNLESIETPDQIALETARAELTERIAAAEALNPIDYDVDDFAHILELVLAAKKLVVDENIALDALEDMIVELEVEMEMLMPIDEDQAFEAAWSRLEDSVLHTNQALEEVDSSNPAYTELLAVLFDANNLLNDESAEATLSQLVQIYNRLESLRHDLFDQSEPASASDSNLDPDLDSSSGSALESGSSDSSTKNYTTARVENSHIEDELLEDDYVPSDELLKPFPESIEGVVADTSFDEDSSESEELSKLNDEPDSSTNDSMLVESDHTADELRTGVTEMLGAVIELTIGDYHPEFQNQFYDLGRAIERAKLLLADPDADPAALAATMNEILAATTGLKDPNESTAINSSQPLPDSTAAPTSPTSSSMASVNPAISTPIPTSASPVQPPLDFSLLGQLITQVKQLNPAVYTEASYAQVLQILQQARNLSTNSAATQTDVNNIVIALNNAICCLQPIPNNEYNKTSSFSTTPATAPSASTTPTTARISTQPIASVASVTSRNSAVTASSTASASNAMSNSRSTNLVIAEPDDTVEPTVMMSILAGAYAGLATYRKNRLAAQKSRAQRKAAARAHR